MLPPLFFYPNFENNHQERGVLIMQFTKFTEEEFKAYTGLDLNQRLDGDDDEEGKVTRFINRCSEDIKDFVIANDFGHIKFDNLSETQNEIINRACMMQGHWIITNGDFSNMSGFDAAGSSFGSLEETVKRIIAPKAKSLLMSRIISRVR